MSRDESSPSQVRPLRIAFFVHYFPVLSEAFIINQAAALIERGHQVDIFAVWGKRPHAAGQFPIAERYGLFERCIDPAFEPAAPARILGGLRHIFGSFKGRWRVLAEALNIFRQGRWAANLRLLFEAAMLDGRGRYDVVHCQFADLAPVVLRLRRIGALQAPIAVHVRGIDITRRPRELGLDTYRQIFADADLVLPNCEYFRRKAVDLGCPAYKLTVFRSAIDLREFAYRGNRGTQQVGIRLALVGRLVEKKGVVYAIEAMAKLIAAGLAVELSVIGDGPLRTALEGRASDLGITDHIHFLGAQGHAQVLALLRDSDLLLAPSITATDGDEDAPVNTLKEAMAIGLPVVATRHGGIPELVRDAENGRLIAERDADALAEALISLIGQRSEWERLGHNGRAAVETDYCLERQTDRLLLIYRSLIQARSGVTAQASAADIIEVGT